jgi:hypothetical protein
MATTVTPSTLRTGLLAGFSAMPELASLIADDAALQRGINAAVSVVERELSTRFTVKRMRGWFGPGAKPVAATGEEYESCYNYQGRFPGDGYQRFVTRVRPVKEFLGGKIKLPGVTFAEADLPVSWFRFQEFGEVMMTPAMFGAPFVSSGALQSLVGFSRGPLPMAVTLDYCAGLDDADLAQWPQLDRMVELIAADRMLPTFSTIMNPEAIASESADGLSQSRSSNFVYKDLHDYFEAEIKKEKDSLLALWDGPGLLVL